MIKIDDSYPGIKLVSFEDFPQYKVPFCTSIPKGMMWDLDMVFLDMPFQSIILGSNVLGVFTWAQFVMPPE